MSSNKMNYCKDTQRSQRKPGNIEWGLKKGRKQGFALSLSLLTMISLLFSGPPAPPTPACCLWVSVALTFSKDTVPKWLPLPQLYMAFQHTCPGPIRNILLVPGSDSPKRDLYWIRRTFGPRPHKPLIGLWPACSQANTKFGGECGETETHTLLGGSRNWYTYCVNLFDNFY